MFKENESCFGEYRFFVKANISGSVDGKMIVGVLQYHQKVLILVFYFCGMIFITKIHLHGNAVREIKSLVYTVHI